MNFAKILEPCQDDCKVLQFAVSTWRLQGSKRGICGFPPKRVEGRTFEFSFPLPGKAQGKKVAHPGKNAAPKTRKNPTVGTSGSQKPERRVPQPNSNSAHQETPAAQAGDTRQGGREYEQAQRKSPERREYQQQLAQEQRQRAKELGRCRNCSKSAILGQSRCETCAENHRQSRRRSNARRRAAAKAMPAAEE